MISFTACTDTLIDDGGETGNTGINKGIGEIVQFTAGTTSNTLASRAESRAEGGNHTETPGETYYMGDASRFVCRMYYKAADSDDAQFDLTEGTKTVSWLVVDGNVGNSLYWNRNYQNVALSSQDADKSNREKYDDYGNDLSANMFYWQNRREHAFLAWTDLNHATLMTGGTTSGTLTSEGKDTYRVKATGTITSWTTLEYDIYDGGHFASISAMAQYVKDTYFSDEKALAEFNERQEEFGKTLDWVDATKHPVFETESYYSKNTQSTPVDGTHRKYGWYKYVITDEDQNPLCTFYFERYQELKTEDRYDEYAANAFDLTRGTKTSINQQPDIVQALTIMKPEGATQAANRVNLYFKHQFSQVQVNIKNAADNSVELSRGDIEKVELLGVTEKGYVFTEIDETGEIRKAAYADIDFSKFTEMQLKDNPFGTSFDMFELPEEQTATGYLKSFNAITYGHLQAIRITWNEQNTDAEGKVTKGKTHAAVFRIPDTELVNLKSGVRYIWNIEVRRGTLAVIRTEIVDWELPKDADHNQTIDGTIQN